MLSLARRAGLRISARPGATAIHKGLPYVGQGFIPCFWSGPGRKPARRLAGGSAS